MQQGRGLEVWHVDLQRHGRTPALMDLLDERERAQAARFRFAHLADAYVVAHAALRSILACWTGQRPQDLAFEHNSFGKPRIAGDAGPVFSLSHTQGAALCAVAPEGEIGVDIERQRPLEHEDLVARFFSPAEIQQFGTFAPAAREAAFFGGWTRKEAYVKARGLGLSIPLNSFSVDLAPGPEPALHASDGLVQDTARFRLWDLAAGAGYSAALAYGGPCGGPPTRHEWRPDSNPVRGVKG